MLTHDGFNSALIQSSCARERERESLQDCNESNGGGGCVVQRESRGREKERVKERMDERKDRVMSLMRGGERREVDMCVYVRVC